ncbi:hypothetical protein ACH5RR_012618 [Cinchona calisaya]|uniref:Ty3 transposon capsid-like protein domain-containing protein n=1 Tax=Cinchona calisaya TaxID=153742 RepID=A0ABD3AAV9_9GENT
MENSDKKLKTYLMNMDIKFNTILRMLSSEKSEQGGEPTGVQKLGILPTPKNRNSQEDEVVLIREKKGKAIIPSPQKIELQMFYEDNPRDLINKCNKFFSVYQIEEPQQMDLVELYLDGKVDVWFQSNKLSKGSISWDEFCKALVRRFGDKALKDEVEEFNKLQQERTVTKYQEKFEELEALMLQKDPRLTEQYFISSFLSGLKEEITPIVKMLKSQTLLDAFGIAKLQERSIEMNRIHSKVKHQGTSSETISSIPSRSASSHYRVLVANDKKTYTKKISALEVQYRRNNGFCFKCGKKYNFGHQCKMRHLNFMLCEDEDILSLIMLLGNRMRLLVTQVK